MLSLTRYLLALVISVVAIFPKRISAQELVTNKPIIEATIIKIVSHEPQYASYDAYYKVVGHGATKISVSVEEEYSPQRRTKTFYNQETIHDVVESITAPYRAWIDFTAENGYGRCVYTIELLPHGEVGGCYLNGEPISSVATVEAGQTERFEIYTLSGIKLCTLDNLLAIDTIDYNGIVIVKRYMGDGEIVVSKVRL